MRAGKLRHRIKIQSVTEAAEDDNAEVVETWTDLATVSAEILPAGGSEGLSADQPHGDATYQISMRYRPGVTIRHRGIGMNAPYTGLVFDFQSVLPVDGRTRELNIVALVRGV